MFFETSASLCRHQVNHYWFSPSSEASVHPIIPDGCVDLVYVLTPEGSGWYAYGTTTQITQQPLIQGATYFGVRLQPGKAKSLVGIPLAALTNQSQSITLPFYPSPNADFGDLCDQANDVLSGVKSPVDYSTEIVQAAIQQIQTSQGRVAIATLAQHLAISERQLNRLFIRDLGISPKVYSRISRFQHITQRLQSDQVPSLTALALDAGYTDQPHFCREIKAMTGCAPRAYQQQVRFLQSPAQIAS